MCEKPTEFELRNMIDEGMTLYQISRKYNTTIPVIFQLAKDYDMKAKSFKLKECYRINKEDLKSMYINEGMTQEQIAEELGYTQANVSIILHECGVPTRPGGKYTAQQRASKANEIVERYNNGETQEEIAKKVGYNKGNVWSILKERGVQTRVTSGTITHQEMALITADKIQECIDKGMNQHQIAEHFNVSDWKIFDLAEKFGIPGMVDGFRCLTPEHIAWRDEVLLRDNYTCQLCGSPERPEAHHIYPFRYYPERQFDVDNGITLCYWCHKKVTGHESEYIVELEDIVLRDRGIGDDIKPGIDFIDYLARKFDQKGVDIFGGELPTHEYTSIPKEE